MTDQSAPTSPYPTSDEQHSATLVGAGNRSYEPLPPCEDGCPDGTAFPFGDTRCAECGCCNHVWREGVCPCLTERCGCRENREWDEAEA